MVQPGVSALGKKKSTTGLPAKFFRLTGLPSSSGTVKAGALSLRSMLNRLHQIRSEPLYRMCSKATGAVSFLAGIHSFVRVSIAAGLLACILPIAICAQKKQPQGPRAIAVVAWTSDRATPNVRTSVLTPIAILSEGRYYDASLYMAQPTPLALDSGVIYDVLKNGDPIGTFTVGGALEKKDSWYGTGLFQDKNSSPPLSAKSGPTLHSRNGGKASDSTTAPAATDDRPRLRRGPPPPEAPKQQSDAELASIDRDPDRPKLHHETENEIQQEKAQQKKPDTNPQALLNDSETHMLAAVSDARGSEDHSFVFHYKDREMEDLRSAMEKLARAELAKSAGKQSPTMTEGSGRKRGREAAQRPPVVPLEDVQFGAFDVNTDNAPIVVYSATGMLDAKKKYITLAAWEEIDESLRKIFAQVTDDSHLDVYPRLELVDALDANGKGRGDLLFRAIGDQGSRFVLYHPGPDSLELLFDSSRAESRR